MDAGRRDDYRSRPAYLSGGLKISVVPPFFKEIFGDDAILRLAVALIGGILMGLGARWAGGCTSGHGISGTLQLSLASWIAVICFFASGIIAAGIIRLQIKPGSIGSTVLGGFIAELVGLRPEIVAPLVAMLIMGLLHMIAVLGL